MKQHFDRLLAKTRKSSYVLSYVQNLWKYRFEACIDKIKFKIHSEDKVEATLWPLTVQIKLNR